MAAIGLTGCGVNDSPVGLAAYILEKFSTCTDLENIHLEDGGLERSECTFDLFCIYQQYFWDRSHLLLLCTGNLAWTTS